MSLGYKTFDIIEDLALDTPIVTASTYMKLSMYPI